MRWMLGLVRIHMASIRNKPLARAVFTSSSDVTASRVNGFSHNTALPASRHTMVAAWWAECGVAT
jgi:hypothetical protein